MPLMLLSSVSTKFVLAWKFWRLSLTILPRMLSNLYLICCRWDWMVLDPKSQRFLSFKGLITFVSKIVINKISRKNFIQLQKVWTEKDSSNYLNKWKKLNKEWTNSKRRCQIYRNSSSHLNKKTSLCGKFLKTAFFRSRKILAQW